jgi:hypothetical protein
VSRRVETKEIGVKLFIDGKCRKRKKLKERRMFVGGNGFKV